MKKNILRILCVGLLLLVSAVGLSACNKGDNVGQLDSQLELQIKQDWANHKSMSIEDVEIHKYYGTYNESVALMFVFKGMSTAETWEETVAGFTFRFGSGWSIQIWSEGVFQELRDAYDLGLLTQADISKIHKLHK